MWFRFYWKVWFVKKVRGTLRDRCSQHTENFTFSGWSASGTLTRQRDKEVKDKSHCGHHSQGPGFCRAGARPQPSKPSQKTDSSSFHGSVCTRFLTERDTLEEKNQSEVLCVYAL